MVTSDLAENHSEMFNEFCTAWQIVRWKMNNQYWILRGNYGGTNIITPIRADVLEDLLREANYEEEQTRYVVNGFRFGFPIDYQGPTERQQTARNLPLRCGSSTVL